MKQPKAKSSPPSPLQLRSAQEVARETEPVVHVFGKNIICNTDTRGYTTPHDQSNLEIVLDATEGFIPLWAADTTLRWRFQERSLRFFRNRAEIKKMVTELLAEALLAWGDAAPVRFAQRNDAWDFEIVVRRTDDCDATGCVLASAFFPDPGRHELVVYPQMFSQDRKEQVDTLIHEIGHIFGLRHFFANVSETAWPSEVFGTHKPFSIMNYGNQSELTRDDKRDLKELYTLAWSGRLTKINGTPIRLVKPFHTIRDSFENMVAVGRI